MDGFAAEAETLGTRFRIGVTFNAAAAAPVRHETIQEALLAEAGRVVHEAETSGAYDFAAHGFACEGDVWHRDYSQREIADLL